MQTPPPIAAARRSSVAIVAAVILIALGFLLHFAFLIHNSPERQSFLLYIAEIKVATKDGQDWDAFHAAQSAWACVEADPHCATRDEQNIFQHLVETESRLHNEDADRSISAAFEDRKIIVTACDKILNN